MGLYVYQFNMYLWQRQGALMLGPWLPPDGRRDLSDDGRPRSTIVEHGGDSRLHHWDRIIPSGQLGSSGPTRI